MRQRIYCTLVAIVIHCAPAFGESRSFPGNVEITIETKRAGEECETGAKAECKVGDLCYANLTIQGEAARVLYEALKKHGAPSGAIGEFATQSEVLACGSDQTGYWCEVGYNAVKNELTYPIYCQPE